MRYSSTEGTWSRNILPPQALQDGARLAGHPAGLGARQEAEDSDRGRGGDSEREGVGTFRRRRAAASQACAYAAPPPLGRHRRGRPHPLPLRTSITRREATIATCRAKAAMALGHGCLPRAGESSGTCRFWTGEQSTPESS